MYSFYNADMLYVCIHQSFMSMLTHFLIGSKSYLINTLNKSFLDFLNSSLMRKNNTKFFFLTVKLEIIKINFEL